MTGSKLYFQKLTEIQLCNSFDRNANIYEKT